MLLGSTSKLHAFGSRSRRYLAIATFGALLLSGCAVTSSPMGSDGQPNIDGLINQAEGELSKGRRDQAIAILNQAAKESPTNMTPWLKISNIWFDEGNYPSAIVAANEVLARDSTNQEAKSILVVAGLRVAASAVKNLVPHNPVSPNARQEAENLTKSLRQALGEKVLVPSEASQASASTQRTRRRAPVARAVADDKDDAPAPVARTASPAVQIDAPKVSISADPFKSLK